MKKLCVCLGTVIFIILCCPMAVAASGEDILEQQMTDSGAHELENALPEDTSEYMDKAGIDMESLGTGEGITISALTEVIGGIFDDTAEKPLSAVCGIIGIIIMSSLIGSLRLSEKGAEKAASAVATIAIALVVMLPIASFIDSTAQTISRGCSFGAVFIPVFAAIVTAFGQGITAAGYSAFSLALSELIMTATGGIVIPMVRIFLSMSTVSAIAPSMKLDGIIEFFDKNSKWLLGLMAALLVGILSVSCVAASAADTAASRAARFVVSSSVPVVGRAISDALSTVQSCVGILRSSVGSFGMIAMMFIFLSSIVQCALWMLGISFCSALAQMLDAGDVLRLLKAVSGVLAMLLALLIFIAVVLIASTAVVLGQKGAV